MVPDTENITRKNTVVGRRNQGAEFLPVKVTIM
jgi:hypothetical protein